MKPLLAVVALLAFTGCIPKFHTSPERFTRTYQFTADGDTAHVLSDLRSNKGRYRLTLITCRQRPRDEPWCLYHVIRENMPAEPDIRSATHREMNPPAPAPEPEPEPDFWEG